MICKCVLFAIYLPLLSSFILTMWYVNKDMAGNLSKWYDGFILTMWYVNEIKGKIVLDEFASFILTMWYVNFAWKP